MSRFINKLNIAKESDKAPVLIDGPEVHEVAASEETPEILLAPEEDFDSDVVAIEEASDDIVEAQSTIKLVDASIKLIGVTDEKSPMFDIAVTAAESLQTIVRLSQEKFGVSVRSSGVESFNPKKLSSFAIKAVAKEAEDTKTGIVAKIAAGLKRLWEMIKGLFKKAADTLDRKIKGTKNKPYVRSSRDMMAVRAGSYKSKYLHENGEAVEPEKALSTVKDIATYLTRNLERFVSQGERIDVDTRKLAGLEIVDNKVNISISTVEIPYKSPDHIERLMGSPVISARKALQELFDAFSKSEASAKKVIAEIEARATSGDTDMASAGSDLQARRTALVDVANVVRATSIQLYLVVYDVLDWITDSNREY